MNFRISLRIVSSFKTACEKR